MTSAKDFVVVGTTNLAKLKAVRSVVEKLFGDVQVIGCKVDSNVSDQPLSDIETMDGAVNRAKAAYKEYPNAKFGGAQKIGSKWFESGWVAVIDDKGQTGLGSSGRFELSPKIMTRLLSGNEELADVIDDLTGETDVRSNQGAMGIFTNGHIPRDVAYEHGIYFAFAPFVSDKAYWV